MKATALSKNSMQLLEELQSTDFALLELTLYLDTHPEDKKAIKQFNELAEQRKSVKDKVEADMGPLRQGDPQSGKDSWEWSSSPWPWQI